MRIRLLLNTATAAALLVALSTGTTTGAEAASTATTFSVGGAALTVTAPATADLGSGTLGGTVSGQIGVVTVNDARGANPAAWSADVSSTAFTTGSGGPSATVPNSDVSYWSGPSTATSGSGTFTPGEANAAAAVTLTTSQEAFSMTGGAGGNSCSWNPTVIVALPSTLQTGSYTGTVTHSVA
ncbi:hypothetical protein ABH925_006488 [Streptacidiphilus sp. EB129]